jgi:hypothetical protein
MTLDDAIDELFGVELEKFVAERTRLVKKLKDDGAKDDAAELAKVRKPTIFAGTLDQLARRERRDVDLLLDAGHRLREAQADLLRDGGGDRVEFERAREIERDALKRLERAAARLLGGSSSSVLPQFSSTLRTAAVSEEGRELLATGRFTVPLDSEGFGSLEGLAPPRRAKPPARVSAAEKQREAKAALREAKARVRELEAAAREAEQRADGLERDAAKARRLADRARAAAEETRRSLGL